MFSKLSDDVKPIKYDTIIDEINNAKISPNTILFIDFKKLSENDKEGYLNKVLELIKKDISNIIFYNNKGKKDEDFESLQLFTDEDFNKINNTKKEDINNEYLKKKLQILNKQHEINTIVFERLLSYYFYKIQFNKNEIELCLYTNDQENKLLLNYLSSIKKITNDYVIDKVNMYLNNPVLTKEKKLSDKDLLTKITKAKTDINVILFIDYNKLIKHSNYEEILNDIKTVYNIIVYNFYNNKTINQDNIQFITLDYPFTYNDNNEEIINANAEEFNNFALQRALKTCIYKISPEREIEDSSILPSLDRVILVDADKTNMKCFNMTEKFTNFTTNNEIDLNRINKMRVFNVGDKNIRFLTKIHRIYLDNNNGEDISLKKINKDYIVHNDKTFDLFEEHLNRVIMLNKRTYKELEKTSTLWSLNKEYNNYLLQAIYYNIQVDSSKEIRLSRIKILINAIHLIKKILYSKSNKKVKNYADIAFEKKCSVSINKLGLKVAPQVNSISDSLTRYINNTFNKLLLKEKELEEKMRRNEDLSKSLEKHINKNKNQ